MFRQIKNRVLENGRVIVLVLATIFIAISLMLTYSTARALHEKEMLDVGLWAAAMERVNRDAIGDYTKDPLVAKIINTRNNIPFIITDENLHVISYHLVKSDVINSSQRLYQTLRKMADNNTPIVVSFGGYSNHNHIIFYGHSRALQTLYYFPLVQLLVIVVFVLVVFMAFRSIKESEQSRVWVGLTKETAHQLGTPTSSLLGWVEYLREQPVEQSAVDEMQKDVSRLMKVVDRFSKIGSDTPLKEMLLNEVVGDAVSYFRKRIPRNVTLEYDGLNSENIKVNLSATLFEWVIENLMKNSLDALQGHGTIRVSIGHDNKNAWVEVSDTGKGIPKSKWKRIFEPGYTTKTRGWGLGLSLSNRVIKEYHKGKIAVVSSGIDEGTTIRVTIKLA